MSEYVKVAPSEGDGAETGQFVTSAGGQVSQTRPSRDRTIPYGQALICWTPLSEIGDAGEFRATAGQVAVLPLDDPGNRCYAYACHAGSIDDPGMPLNRTQAQAAMLELFNRLSLQGIKPRRIHEAFLAVVDYRRALHISIPGALRPPGYAAKANGTDREP